VIRKVEQVVSPDTIIGSNTSAIPPTQLQQGALHPKRILGTHWAEPAHITRFMEIICGMDMLPVYAERALALTRQLGKEPSLLRKDVRGFITNRVMYTMLREAFHLVESGAASIADVDRSLRNDLGYWITFAGPFRFMDLTGIPAYRAVMRDLLPDLDCSQQVPALMERMVESGARVLQTRRAFTTTLRRKRSVGKGVSWNSVMTSEPWRGSILKRMRHSRVGRLQESTSSAKIKQR
jgi:3-hydroxybutyryl-CoA dehydrogenase